MVTYIHGCISCYVYIHARKHKYIHVYDDIHICIQRRKQRNGGDVRLRQRDTKEKGSVVVWNVNGQ